MFLPCPTAASVATQTSCAAVEAPQLFTSVSQMNWVMIPVVPVVSFVRLHEGERTNVLRRAVVVALLVDGLEGELLAVVESERACDDVSTRLEGGTRRRTLDLGHGARAKVGRVG